MPLRIIASFFILLSILFFPIWASILIAFISIIYFRMFWEAILLLFISDLLFGISEFRYLNITVFSTILILCLLLLIEYIKRKLKFYQK